MGERPGRLSAAPERAVAVRRARAAAAAALLGLAAAPAVVAAQEPADTIPTDTLAADTIAGVPDRATQADSVAAFPEFPTAARAAPGRVAGWTHRELTLTGALTLAQLLAYDAPIDPMRAGFLEAPTALVFAGAGAAGVRLRVDGYEVVPLGGSALDWHQPSLVELDELELIREPGGFEVAAGTYRRRRPEAYSRIEGGTGDVDTNIIRGIFVSEFLGGPVGLGFDQVDTRGVGELGSSKRTALWGSLARPLLAGIWGQIEFRRSTVDRDTGPAPQRTDWIARLRRPFGSGWHAELLAGSGQRHDQPADASDSERSRRVTARQLAFRAARVSESWRAQASVRAWDGDSVPELEPELSAELTLGPVALFGRVHHADWGAFRTTAAYAAARLELPFGLWIGGDIEDGDRGALSPAHEPVSFRRWNAGAGLRRWGWTAAVRAGRWRVRPSPGLGLPFDSAAAAVDGGTVGVFELSGLGRVLDLFGGTVRVGGAYRGREAADVLYWPLDEWRLEGRYDALLLEDQLEVILRGVGGVRGELRVPDPSLGPGGFQVTGDLSWFWGELVVRIKDVTIFWTYEAFEGLPSPQDVPGFPLPRGRTHFGLKWEFWN